MPKKHYIKYSNIVRKNKKAVKRAAKGFGGKSSAINGKIFTSIAAILILLAALFVTFNENILKNDDLPTWNKLSEFFGLKPEMKITELPDGNISVHFIDVGQGDSGLIITPEFNILIDSGEKEYYPKVLNYLSLYGIDTLHYVIATHPHSDHIGGLSYIMSEVKTEKIIMPEVKDEIIPTTGSFTRLLISIESNGTEASYAKVGERINIGGGAYIDIIAPLDFYDDLNDCSIVFKLTHGENTFLFTGDIEKSSENDILDAGSDISAKVLKVAHHGSRTSSKTAFLKAVGGEYAVIGVGMPNTYNHPNNDTLKNLALCDYTVYRTDLNGDIVFISDGSNLEIKTQKE